MIGFKDLFFNSIKIFDNNSAALEIVGFWILLVKLSNSISESLKIFSRGIFVT